MPASIEDLNKAVTASGDALKKRVRGAEIRFGSYELRPVATKPTLEVRTPEDGELAQVSTTVVVPPKLDLKQVALLCMRLSRVTTAIQYEFEGPNPTEDPVLIRLVADHPVMDGVFGLALLAEYLAAVAEARSMLFDGLESLHSGENLDEAFVVVCRARDKWRREADTADPHPPSAAEFATVAVGVNGLLASLLRLDVEHEVVAGGTDGEHVLAILPTNRFKGTYGDCELRARITLNTKSVRVEVTLGCQNADASARSLVAGVLMQACRSTEVFQAEIDAEGEVYLVAELMTLGAVLTDRQVRRVLDALTTTADAYDTEIRQALARHSSSGSGQHPSNPTS